MTVLRHSPFIEKPLCQDLTPIFGDLKKGKETILFNTYTNDFFIAEAIHSIRTLEPTEMVLPEFAVFSLWFNKSHPEILADETFAEELKKADFIECDDYSDFIDLIKRIKGTLPFFLTVPTMQVRILHAQTCQKCFCRRAAPYHAARQPPRGRVFYR